MSSSSCCLRPTLSTIINRKEFFVVPSKSSYPPMLKCRKCRKCRKCVAVRFKCRWRSLERILTTRDKKRNGWMLARPSGSDRFRHSVLSKIAFSINNPPDVLALECHFSDPDPGMDDMICLWKDGRAVGFATLRKHDHHIPTLDSIWVAPGHRGQGHARALVQRLLCQNDVLGLSSPLSVGMLVTVVKLMKCRPDLRTKIWLVEEVGQEVESTNIWWAAPALAQERNVDLTSILTK